MPTPSIQTLTTDAQQVLNLDSISAVRSVVAVALANANTGTPLNPNLTTQQLWDQFYQVVTRPKSDIESIIANQLMKFLYSPPAPGGAGADKQVIFNDGGVLAGDADFLWNKTTNLLTVTGSATITGALTAAGNSVIGTGSAQNAAAGRGNLTIGGTGSAILNLSINSADTGYVIHDGTNISLVNRIAAGSLIFWTNSSTRYQIASDGVATWSNVGGVAGTAMTLNSTGLGIGVGPSYPFHLRNSASAIGMVHSTNANGPYVIFQNSTGNFGDIGSELAITGGGSAGNLTLNSRSTSNLCFSVSDTVRMRIDSSGNVGIGVTPSAWTLKSLQIVAGGIYGSGNETGYYANAFYGSSGWRYINAAGASGYLQNGGSHQWYRSTSANVAGTDPVFSQAMTLDASGRLLVGPTSANTSGGVLQLSSGITFPATQVASSDPNTLDDYEEGTWTANLEGGTTNPTTPVTVTGTYIKIGRQVTIDAYFNNVNTTGASGQVIVTGLPFSTTGRPVGGLALYNFDFNTGTSLYCDISGSVVFFGASKTNGAWVDVLHNAGAGRYARLTATYYI